MEPYWSEANGHAPHSVKYESEAAVSSFPYCTESSLNFSTSATTYSEDDAEYATGRRNKTSRQDPLSHRIIEKRRRDRMNSCLADLSRLIPPQYQRKGRGRIEKTEIIEMAIRHLKHLQSECIQKENDYRLGYTDCMKEAAKFLYESQMQDFCYRLVARLQEHCDEVLKNDCYKSSRGGCHVSDNVSASSGSPHQPYHPAPPICQLRDMLTSSDIEHSIDHNDVKDLSFRNHINQLQRNLPNGTIDNHNIASSNSISPPTGITNNNLATSSTTTVKKSTSIVVNNATSSQQQQQHHQQQQQQQHQQQQQQQKQHHQQHQQKQQQQQHQQPHQAPVITSTAPSSLLHHTDCSNHDDFESSREPILHAETSSMHSPPPRDSLLHHQHHHSHHHAHTHAHLNHHQNTSDSLLSARMRNFSESSHEIEHNNNYKYKNHIKERFNHELHDEETSSEHCHHVPSSLLQNEHSHAHSEHSKDGTEPEIAPIMAKKRKLAEANDNNGTNLLLPNTDDADARAPQSTTSTSSTPTGAVPITNGVLTRDEKSFAFAEIKTEMNSNSGSCNSNSKTMLGLPSSTTTVTGAHARSFSVPIFALHGQGTYYIPLNVDYSVLLPYLNGIDLLEKNYTTMPVVHPININVNFMPVTPPASLLAAAAAAAAVAAGKQQPPPIVNGSISAVAAVAAAAVAKAKLETITNGW